MKFELIMLTTVISVITERQVEALFECYEHVNLTGIVVKFGSNPDVTSQLSNGPRACKVPANSTVIFYKQKNHRGDVNFLHTLDSEVFYPSIVVRSILYLGQREGIFVFPEKDFQGGLSTHFDGEKDKVPGNVQVKSAAVIRKFWDWTLARRCHVSDCQRTCSICLLQPKTKSKASFIKSIDSTGMGQILTVLPGTCLGKNYTGISRNPCPQGKLLVKGECEQCVLKCDPKGIADKKKPCDANGNCVCRKGKKGLTCSKNKGDRVSCHFCDNDYRNHCRKASGITTYHYCRHCLGIQVVGRPASHNRMCSNNRYKTNGCIKWSNKVMCYCDDDYCSNDLTKYANDPNYPILQDD